MKNNKPALGWSALGGNKKILANLGTITITAILAIGGTYAYLNNVSKVTSTTFAAGGADLKIKMPQDGCPDWSDSCAGKTWNALYPGWNDSYNIYLKNDSLADISLEIIPYIEETGSSQDLWDKSYMEITWSDGSHSTGRKSFADWKTNTTIGLVPILAKGQEAGPWVVKFDIDPSAGNEIANTSISFNVVFDGVQEGGEGGGDSAVCGNGSVESGEQCDDGNTTAGDGCSASCQSENPVCGNNIIETGEQCDDGNNTAGDGCSATCQTENISSPEVCDGLDNDLNGIIDDGNPGGGSSCDTNLLGVCATGTTICSNGGLICSQNILPANETCEDGLDNDCDGTVDNGCVPADGTSCSDGNACNGMETYSSGICTDGTPLNCNDGDSSTADSCDAQSGCVFTQVP